MTTAAMVFGMLPLALAFISARLAYIACYLADLASLRSLVWLVGLGSSIALFVVSA